MNPDAIIGFLNEAGTVFCIAVTVTAIAMARLPQGNPNTKWGRYWDATRTVVNYLAQNYGHAANIVEYPPTTVQK